MTFTDTLIRFSYWLEDKDGYWRVKNFVNRFLNDSDSISKRYFDIFMIILVLSTIAIFIYEIKNPIFPWMYSFEGFAVTIFIFEWLGRLWVCSSISKDIIKYSEKRYNLAMDVERKKILKIIFLKKIKFIFSPMSIIDLLAILPYYRPLRMLRFFLLFRLFKLMRYASIVKSLLAVFRDKMFELLVLVAISFFVIMMASTVMYTVEGLGDNPNLNTFFDSIYWAIVTMATVGYGDIVPETGIGKLVSIMLMGGGLMVVVLATSIITSAFTERLSAMREDRVKQDFKKRKNSIIILGYGRMGASLASMLHKEGRKFIIVDSDIKKIEEARSCGYLAYMGDVSDYDTLDEIVFNNNVSAIAVLTDKDSVNLSVLLAVKASSHDIKTIIRANEKSNIKKLEVSGADYVVFPFRYLAHEAVEYIKTPATFDALDNIIMEKNGIKIDKLRVHKKSIWISRKLQDLDIKSFRITLIGVFNKNSSKMIFKPNQKEYILQEGDKIVVIGIDEQIELLARKLRKR